MDFHSCGADICVYGGGAGGGKTYSLCLEPLRHIRTKGFGCVTFRRTYPSIFAEGSLWDTAASIYPYFGGQGSVGNAEWNFPKWGTRLGFSHMANESDKDSWLSAQIPLIQFDQLEEFSATQFWYMLGRNRTTCGVRPYIRAGANPKPGWLADLLQWWWDPQTGYAIEERSGVVRWFVRVKGRLYWFDSKAEAKASFPNGLPMSFTFIKALVDDNAALLEKDPDYRAKLDNMLEVERERYLKGNWKIKLSAGMLLKREWFKVVPASEVPARVERDMRYWDLAATGEENPNFEEACFTAGARIALNAGRWFVRSIKRCRVNPAEQEEFVANTASQDGRHVQVRIEKEGGSGGPIVESHYARHVLVGYDFTGSRDKFQKKDKVTRAGVVASAAKLGNVMLVATGDQKQDEWIEQFLTDCDNAPDGWMDMIDSLSGGMIEMGAATGGGNKPQAVQTRTASVWEHEGRGGVLV